MEAINILFVHPLGGTHNDDTVSFQQFPKIKNRMQQLFLLYGKFQQIFIKMP